MEFRILAVGDVCGDAGVRLLEKSLRRVKREHGVDFCVVNGENAATVGILPRQADAILEAGADVITLGNHSYNRKEIAGYLDESRWILRPANDSPRFPGRGVEYPARVTLLDFHAEASSEKLAMGWYLDGKISALWGTHTHVPTADNQILPKGTGYVTDLGMTGPIRSVIGIRPEQSVATFRGGLNSRYETAPGPCKLEAVLFTVESTTGRCVNTERIWYHDTDTARG